ncbi:MAG: hypothetical protein HY738_21090 [Bacteroidia bacterium]|nr:hypothetical protein [Bacteroidia bacterium]
MKTKFFFLLVCMVSHSLITTAQTSTVRLLDLTLIPVVDVNNPTGNPDKYNVSFKVNDVSQASVVHLLFGSVQGQGDILTVEAGIVNTGDGYAVEYGGQQFPVYGIQSSFIVPVTSQQMNDYAVASLYVTDTGGQNSQVIYFTK